MDRQKTLNKAFQRGHLLNLKSKFYKEWFSKFIVDEVEADIGTGDLTSDAVIKNGRIATGIVKSRDDGIAAGIEEAAFLYKKNNIKAIQLKKDGSKIIKGDVLLKLKGKEKDLLRVERNALDILQRMSGIATLTGQLINKIKNRVQIAPTRKTYWRYLDKKAVYLGGGLTHRLALWDAILIKDNHLFALKNEKAGNVIEESIMRASKKIKNANFIEIEVSSKSQAIAAAQIFKKLQLNLPCLIMLDNMKPNQIKVAVKTLKKLRLHNSVLIEASGGINPENIIGYSKTGVDVISLGYLTHAPWTIDIKQYIEKK